MTSILDDNIIILFTRIPVAGKTKTRLMPFLKPGECVNLHFSFMADEIAQICKSADRLEVCYLEDESVTDDDCDDFRSFLMEEVSIPFCTFAQRGNDVFERMSLAFRDSFKLQNNGRQAKRLLIGCDLPFINEITLDRAFEDLDDSDVVFGPSDDGGYYLVGMSDYEPSIFHVSGDGASDVLSKTLLRCKQAFLNVSFGQVLADVDTPEDLYNLWLQRETLPEDSLTRSFLDTIDPSRFELAGLCGETVSVIVPVYNEMSTIETFIENLADIAKQAEIIFADGGSTDGTAEFIEKHLPKNAKLLRTEKGRAVQMNEAAKAAKGDYLMFLHADCVPPKNLVSEVRKTLHKTNWGCFGVKFDDKDPLMLICQIISNNRIHDRKVVFGDQGIFIKRELFFEIGGFPELPIMEDYQLSLTLKDKGEKIGVAKGLIETSSRRYHEGGKLSVMWKMNRLRKAYRDGVPIEEISNAYKDIR
ncbi:MAG: TIGR04283 family arsenosugar biosynthesis glycosyltransferase [Phoenicibacter congonensis]|uniref:4,4'-diaponeurosporenoate glycosyltransferase n=1 Tax=Phoenicibacter congonensis TaxID=1944646 RepID=A0AA43RIJ6_9ACTN|nr:TIGR04283 family arsenosugar biosynthesis glycosyltransferase [Phoenicibacter congonensis]